MREDPSGSQLLQPNREPRIAIGWIYPTGSIYVTNKAAGAIANVPGNVVAGCLEDVASTSQELYPAEGRSTIGSLEFSVVDVDGALTDELRDQLANNDRGAGRREVRVWTGDTDDFTDTTWSQVETYQVDSVIEYDRGRYRVSCSDVQRQLRERIFAPAKTRITADLAVDGTVLTVDSTDGFTMVAHTAAFGDAPSATVGYLIIPKTKEVLRYTGKTATTFTGITRNVWGSPSAAIDVDPAADPDRQPEVVEYVYLEMPAVQLLYALLTGKIKGTSDTLPSSWHLGISESLVEGDMFDQIGTDLYDSSDPTAGLVLRFRGEQEQDGKQFCEEQLHVPMWTFSPITPEGKIGLRRLTRVLRDAAPATTFTTANIISHGPLQHRVGDVINRVIVRWNWDGEEFTRETTLVNAGSISKHGLGRTRLYEFRGLTVTRHTAGTLTRIFNAISDRNGSPPLVLDAQLSSTMNDVEVGDVARTILPNVRDYSAASFLDRAFELQSRRMNWRTGALEVTQFGSSASEEDQPPGVIVPVDDSWYESEGTELSTVLTISGGQITANGNLTAGIYYFLGDLQLNSGITVTINGTVQLRVRGTLTTVGTWDGIGRGTAAPADPNTVGLAYVAPSYGASFPRYPQTIGSTRASDGIEYLDPIHRTFHSIVRHGVPAVPRPALEVIDGDLYGLPAELQGTPGTYGFPVNELAFGPTSRTVRALGGAGGAGGAGLCLVSRGTPIFSGAGKVDLSGADGAAPGATVSLGGRDLYAGAGGGGAPGGFLVVLDGTDQVLPDLTTAFVALVGDTPQQGNPVVYHSPFSSKNPNPPPAEPWTGNSPGIANLDLWESASLSVWVPTETDLGEGEDEKTPAPTSLTATVNNIGVKWDWDDHPDVAYTELWVATTNDRTGALLAARIAGTTVGLQSDTVVTRYGWVRNYDPVSGFSDWFPSSPTAGVSATYGGANVNAAGTMGLKIGYRTDLSTVDADAIAIVGIGAGGAPAASTDGHYYWQGTKFLVDHESWNTNRTLIVGVVSTKGYIVHDSSLAAPFNDNAGPNNSNLGALYLVGSQWYQDANGTAVAVTPTSDWIVIGYYETDSSGDVLGAGTSAPRTLSTSPAPGGEADADQTGPRLDSANVLTNAGFETGTSEGWVSNVQWSLDGNGELDRTWSAKITSGTTGLRAANENWLPSAPSERFLLTCVAARDESDLPDADLSVQLRNRPGGNPTFMFATTAVDRTVSGRQFVHLLGTVNASEDPLDSVQIVARKDTGSSGAWFVDSFTLTPLLTDAEIDALGTANAPAEAGADATVSNADSIIFYQSAAPSSPNDGWIWVDTDDGRIYQRRSAAWNQIGANNALILDNAPAESGADVTGDNESANDWDPSTIDTFTPSWVDLSGWSGTLSYQLSKDGSRARMWTDTIRTATQTGAGPYFNNLPSAIRPAGSSFIQFQRVGGLVTNGAQSPAFSGVRIAGASHGSAGYCQITLLDSNVELNWGLFDGSGSFALLAGWEQEWPLS